MAPQSHTLGNHLLCLMRVLMGKLCVSVQQYITHLATMCAELVLPMPGGPDSSTAFLVMSLGLACRHSSSINASYMLRLQHG